MKSELLQNLYQELDPLDDLTKLLMDAIDDDPPVSVHEGGILKEGYSSEVDELRMARRDGKSWLSDLEAKERTLIF